MPDKPLKIASSERCRTKLTVVEGSKDESVSPTAWRSRVAFSFPDFERRSIDEMSVSWHADPR